MADTFIYLVKQTKHTKRVNDTNNLIVTSQLIQSLKAIALETQRGNNILGWRWKWQIRCITSKHSLWFFGSSNARLLLHVVRSQLSHFGVFRPHLHLDLPIQFIKLILVCWHPIDWHLMPAQTFAIKSMGCKVELQFVQIACFTGRNIISIRMKTTREAIRGTSYLWLMTGSVGPEIDHKPVSKCFCTNIGDFFIVEFWRYLISWNWPLEANCDPFKSWSNSAD